MNTKSSNASNQSQAGSTSHGSTLQQEAKAPISERIRRYALCIRTVLTTIFVIVVLSTILGYVYDELRGEAILVEQFVIASPPTNRDITADGVTALFAHHLQIIQREQRQRNADLEPLDLPILFPRKPTTQLNVQIPQTNLSLRNLLRYVKYRIGQLPLIVTGNATLSEGNIRIILNVQGR